MKRIALAIVVLLAFAPQAAARDYVKLVDPWVESDIARYFFFQSASNPFSFVKLRPDTSTNAAWGTGYRRNEDQVKGFSHVHEWQMSGIQVMPTTGDVPKTEGDTGWQSHVDHDVGEIAEPGYHRLHLDRYDIDAELTATDRVGLHRYRYEKGGPERHHRQPRRAVGRDADGRRARRARRQPRAQRLGQPARQEDASCTSTSASTGRSTPCTAGSATHERGAGGRALRRPDGRLRALRPPAQGRGRADEGRALADRRRTARRATSRPSCRAGTSRASSATRRSAGTSGWARSTSRAARTSSRSSSTPTSSTCCAGAASASDADGKLPRRHVEHRPRPPGEPPDVPLRRALADAVERQLDARPRLPRGLLELRQVAAADVQGRRAAAARPGGRRGHDGDDRLAGDVVHHGRDQQGHHATSTSTSPTTRCSTPTRPAACSTRAPSRTRAGAAPAATRTTSRAASCRRRSAAARCTAAPARRSSTRTRTGRWPSSRASSASAAGTSRSRPTVTQSSGVGARVTDGRPERSGDIRWVPTDDAPWVQLDWDEAPRVTKVVVTDPGTLRFSDGTSVQVQPGETRVDKQVSWVRFEGDGLTELEVWDDRDTSRAIWRSARATGATSTTPRPASSGPRTATARG